MKPRRSRSIEHSDSWSSWERVYSHGRVCEGPPAGLSPSGFDRTSLDAHAAWQRWHSGEIHHRLETGPAAWLCLFERARVEVLASRDLRGMGKNLENLEAISPPNVAAARIYRAARQAFSGRVLKREELILLREPRHSSFGGRIRRLTSSLIGIGKTDPNLSTAPPDSDEIRSILEHAADLVEDEQRFSKALTALSIRLSEALGYPTGDEDPPEFPGNAPDEKADGESGALEYSDSAVSEPGPGEALRDQTTYRISSSSWDEIDFASRWFCDRDREAVRSLLAPERQKMRRLAHRLQRRILADRMRRWHFDREEGVLDSRRLSRLIGERPDFRVFRVEDQAPAPVSAVTLLVDQSGSMRGRPQQLAAIAIDLAVHTLEHCGIACEVLGFTTAGGVDNPVHRAWRDRGSPQHPGRLNALRHLIYKPFTHPWRRCRQFLGLLLREDFGQENIDGEALQWAATRLADRPEPRKVLLVLSDGRPFDRATAEANGREYLENHLRVVVESIEKSPIRLAALGTTANVGLFYSYAQGVRSPDEVPETLFRTLGELLAAPDSRRAGRSSP